MKYFRIHTNGVEYADRAKESTFGNCVAGDNRCEAGYDVTNHNKGVTIMIAGSDCSLYSGGFRSRPDRTA